MAAVATKDRTDLGVILYLTPTAGSTAFNNSQAKAISSVAITSGTWQASTGQYCVTRGDKATVTLHGALAVGQTCKARLEVARTDLANPTIWPDAITSSAWSSIQCTRGDNGSTSNEHIILPADMVSTFDGSSKQDIVLQTSDFSGNGQMRLIVNLTQAGGGIDLVVATFNITAGNTF